jgi:hypothetical protein
MGWLVGFIAKSALMQSPVGAFLKMVPAWAWKALAIAALLLGLFLWHQLTVRKHDVALIHQAKVEQFAHDQAQLDAARKAAVNWKRKADQANSRIHDEEKARHDQNVAHNRALADALRLRLRAKAQPVGRGGSVVSGASGIAGWSGGPLSQANAGVVGETASSICVPGAPLIDYAEQADNDHDALIRIEDTWRRYQQNQPKPKP